MKNLKLVIIAVLTAVLLCSCNVAENQGLVIKQKEIPENTLSEEPKAEVEKEVSISSYAEPSNDKKESAQKTIVTDAQLIEEKATENNTALTCTLVVSCDIILKNMDRLKPEKIDFVPENGKIFDATDISFDEGDSVFDILREQMKNNKIHMEFVENPMYKSAYIKGINNIYEFDCGELSGWVYRVNGETQGIGCSLFYPQNGDRIEFIYSCDMGRDL